MKVLNKFTIKNLKLNKKRTIVTIIGIALSTALIAAVAGMVTSFQQTLINTSIRMQGNYHTAFKDISKEDIGKIETNKEVKSYFITDELGWAKLKNSKNEYKPYLRVLEYDEKAFENNGVNLTEGRFAKNENEIVISEEINLNGRVGLKLGDEITLEVGERKLIDGTILKMETPYELPNNSDTDSSEEIISEPETKTYKIVGIMERPSGVVENYSSPGYTVITFMKTIKDRVDIFAEYKSPKKYEDNNEFIGKLLYGDYTENIVKEKLVVNKNLLRFQGAIDEAALNTLYGIGAVVMSIIIVTSIFVIRNSFSISVAEKNKQYGMLSSIGSTAKQIRRSVIFEGLVVGAIAIPIGIMLGMIAIVALLAIMNGLLADMLNGVTFIYSVPTLPILGSIILSVITIYLSCLLPSIRASKISAIESIRGNNDVNIKSKKLKTPKIIKKLFGIGGVIASKNLKRSRKKYRTTIISIVLSVVIFVALSSFLQCGRKMTDIYYAQYNFNVILTGGDKELYEKIAKNDNTENYAYSYSTGSEIDLEKYGTDIGKQIIAEDLGEKQSKTSIEIIAYNKEYFKKYLTELNISSADYKSEGILIDEFKYTNTNNEQSMEDIYNIKNGQKFNIKIDDKDRIITNLKRTDKRPMGMEGCYGTSGFFITSEDFISNTSDGTVTLYVQSKDANALENRINDLKKTDKEYENINISNYETYINNENRMYTLISIFLYGFITVITLIGVTNIFNTITTNMILRSKEFAMLKSIGMTTKEFNRMIRLESILYGLKSLLIGLPIGIVGSYAIYKAFAGQVDIGYTLPLTAIILSIVFVFVIIGLTMRYSLKKINEQNIIDTIRKDNI